MSENQEVLHEAAPVQIADDEVKLSDGRTVKLRETTGADDAAVAQMLGNKVSLDGASAQILIQAQALKSIVSIDGQNPGIMKSYNDYLGMARGFKSKDMNRILKKYMELNFEADDINPLA
jgi:hypothetical protein